MTKKIEEQIQKLEEKVSELENSWKRALADYQNLEKRNFEERESFVSFANSNLVSKILPAVDSLDKAQEHLDDEGLGLAIKQLKDALYTEGLEIIEAKVGEEFNPENMECVEVVEGNDGKIVEQVRPGYKLNNRIVRCAQVKSSAKG